MTGERWTPFGRPISNAVVNRERGARCTLCDKIIAVGAHIWVDKGPAWNDNRPHPVLRRPVRHEECP